MPKVLKKVLIISYFYPPSNFVGGERTHAWAKYLYENGIYPIIVTRQWNQNQKELTDKLDSNKLKIEKSGTYEIHRIPYHRNLRDRCSTFKALRLVQKFLTLWELVVSNFRLKTLPYSNFLDYSKKLIESDKSIKVLIASGRPFQSFGFGYKLKKQFPDLIWLPDYRDEWSTHPHNKLESGIRKWINQLERKSEIKWTSNAEAFITVSDHWSQRISKFIGKEGVVIKNGYDQLHYPSERLKNDSTLRLLYAGSIYPSQDLSILTKAIANVVTDRKKVELIFIGSVLNTEQTLTLQSIPRDNFALKILPRVSREKLKDYVENTDILVLTSFKNIKGWYPVKLFEYFASGKFVLLAPGDNDVMSEFVIKSNCGSICDTSRDCTEVLLSLINKKISGESTVPNRDLNYGEMFSRSHQSKLLAEKLVSFMTLDN